MTELEQYIHSYFGVSKEEIFKITSYFHPTTLEKGEYFLKSGQVADKLSFHRTGIIRVYLSLPDKEVTQWISTPGYFITDLAGLIFDKPSRYHIQALTGCEMYTISKNDYNLIANSIPTWHYLEKLFIARCFTMLEDRISVMLSLSAEERYVQLFSQQKHLFREVPLQYLASMLGMTPETLSRIRKKNRN